jgi:hypothetical protein
MSQDDDFSWATTPEMRQRLERQLYERRQYAAMFLPADERDYYDANGVPVEAWREYITLCMEQARENIRAGRNDVAGWKRADPIDEVHASLGVHVLGGRREGKN